MGNKESEVDSFQALFDWIGALARRRYQTAESRFSKLALSHTEARLLTFLSKQGGGAAQEALSSMLLVDRSNVGRALKRLEQEGHLVRSRDDVDKRAKFVQMTPKGRKTVHEISVIRKAMAQTFFGDLRPEEAAEIVALLTKAFAGERLEGPGHP